MAPQNFSTYLSLNKTLNGLVWTNVSKFHTEKSGCCAGFMSESGYWMVQRRDEPFSIERLLND